jgi:hypothetical protein
LSNVTLTPGTQNCTPVTAGQTCTTLTMNADGTITVPIGATPGSYTYTYTICTNPAAAPAACDTATATVIVSDTPTTLTAVVTNVPSGLAPGETVPNVTLTCTNTGSNNALNANCAPSVDTGTIGTVTCTPPVPASVLAPNASIVCTFPYTAPGTPGGSDTPQTTVNFGGKATSTNAPTVNATPVPAPIIDAIDDGPTTIGSVTGGNTPSVLGNDTVGTNPATLSNVTLTPGVQACTGCTGTPSTLVMNPDGTITVPPNATPGTYTYTYTICTQPAATPAACDTATATVIVGNTTTALTATVTNVPSGVAPGETVPNVTLTCTNTGSSVALATTCVPNVDTGTIGTITCNPTTPNDLAAGASIVCTFPYTAPGTPGGSDTPQTTVNFGGTASSTSAPTATAPVVPAPIIDAIDDNFGTVSGGKTASVLGNDTTGTSAATTSNVTLTPGAQSCTPLNAGATCSTLTMNADGTITVPAGATPGTYTYTYQICTSPASTPAACDTATATLVVAQNLFDPPFITKAATLIDAKTIKYSIVLINNAAANAALGPELTQLSDPVPAGLTYVSGDVKCQSFGAAVVIDCSFDPVNKRIVSDAMIAYDNVSSANAASAPDRVVITFTAQYTADPIPVTNIASTYWDKKGDGSVADDIAGGQSPVTALAAVTPPTPPEPVPAISLWGLLAMAFGLTAAGAGGLRKRQGRSSK